MAKDTIENLRMENTLLKDLNRALTASLDAAHRELASGAGDTVDFVTLRNPAARIHLVEEPSS